MVPKRETGGTLFFLVVSSCMRYHQTTGPYHDTKKVPCEWVRILGIECLWLVEISTYVMGIISTRARVPYMNFDTAQGTPPL